LRRVLEALKAQTLPAHLWELVLVDNRSPVAISDRFDISWHPNGRHIREEELGLTPARLTGISNARASLLLFVDADNVLSRDYLEQAQTVGVAHPFLGAWGGTITPEFEHSPPEWTRAYWSGLAVREVIRPIWTNAPDYWQAQPCGAGLCVRGNVAQAYLRAMKDDLFRRGLDRSGSSLMSLGDTDLVLTAADEELGWGNFPQLKLTHLIPPDRLTEPYLLRLMEGMAASEVVLVARRGGVTPPVRFAYDWFRFLITLSIHGPRSARFRRAKARGIRKGYQLISGAAPKQYLPAGNEEHVNELT
jgi:glycosyltransferase involved in cell wall biosynthesis